MFPTETNTREDGSYLPNEYLHLTSTTSQKAQTKPSGYLLFMAALLLQKQWKNNANHSSLCLFILQTTEMTDHARESSLQSSDNAMSILAVIVCTSYFGKL